MHFAFQIPQLSLSTTLLSHTFSASKQGPKEREGKFSSMASSRPANVGILAMDIYFPPTCVTQVSICGFSHKALIFILSFLLCFVFCFVKLRFLFLVWLCCVFCFDGFLKNIFSENENMKQLENENNKFSFSVFSVENRNLILVKMKLRWQWM